MRNNNEYEKEIKQLLSKMTLKEKVGQLNQKLYGWNVYNKIDNGYELTEEFKEHIKWGGGVGALYGIFRADPWSGVNFNTGISKEDSIKVTDMIQQYIKENTRLGIPALVTEECPHGHQALDGEMFPSNISMGSTWNTKLIEEVASCISNELSQKGGNLALVSTLDVLRDPRWGRSEECFSEDPYLCSKYTESIVNGYQKEDFNNGVAVVLKHLCAQGATVGGHNSGAANIGERELREVYLPPVEAGVKSGALGVMAAYNEIDGVPCHSNRRLLTDILRDEYGYKGIVMADGCALDRLLIMTRNIEVSGQLAINAGVDLSLWDDTYTHLESAVSNDVIKEEDIDLAVSRMLYIKFKLGLFNKKTNAKTEFEDVSEINKKAALESMVLLKNNGVLPLNQKKKKIAVIGPNADAMYNQLGDYTSPQREGSIITVLDGIKNIVSDEIEVNYASGCAIRNTSKDGFEEAIKLAKESDIAIVVVGGSSTRNFGMKFESNGAVTESYNKDEMNCGENMDLANLDLSGVQAELVKEIKQTGTKVVVVLIQGRPHSISNIIDYCDGILCAWYPGKLGGYAVAETLFGQNNPSGKLAVSIPVSSMQLPCYYNGKDSGAKVDYSDMQGTALFPFGYGLSYTKYEYSDLKLDKTEITREELLSGKEITVSVNVKNVGNKDGLEVVQLYTKDMESTITRRFKELKGFEKVAVNTGKITEVQIKVSAKELSIWDINMNNLIEAGEVMIMVGPNSEELLEVALKIK